MSRFDILRGTIIELDDDEPSSLSLPEGTFHQNQAEWTRQNAVFSKALGSLIASGENALEPFFDKVREATLKNKAT